MNADSLGISINKEKSGLGHIRNIRMAVFVQALQGKRIQQ